MSPLIKGLLELSLRGEDWFKWPVHKQASNAFRSSDLQYSNLLQETGSRLVCDPHSAFGPILQNKFRDRIEGSRARFDKERNSTLTRRGRNGMQ
ncbi:hypothetical protein KFK09_005002 [Dendrobium nobile]|uniref:Uncharacterized protein n=1 Tax=Dendrobium nobile TaxID=94219 RepID=A0A8T3BUL7_DENNO|nr:hypothetical protein KFK09_005002 [Dendrobium nobile]